MYAGLGLGLGLRDTQIYPVQGTEPATSQARLSDL